MAPVLFAADLPAPVLTRTGDTYKGAISRVADVSRVQLNVFARLAGGAERPLAADVLFSADLASFEFKLRVPPPDGAECVFAVQTVTLPDGAPRQSDQSNCVNVPDPQPPAWIDLQSRPIFETDTAVSGKASDDVKTVRVRVFSPGSSQRAGNVYESLAASRDSGRGARLPELYSLAQKIKQSARANSEPIEPEDLDTFRCASGDVEQQFDLPVKDGAFSGAFPRQLTAGQCVIVRQWKNGAVVASERPPAEFVRAQTQDWGRLRGTLYLGLAAGKSRGSLGQFDPYVGFYADANIFSSLMSPRCRAGRACANPTDAFGLKRFRIGFHLFADTRLSQALLPTGKAGESDQAQIVQFQYGVYFPIAVDGMDFVRSGQQYSFFVAPLVKHGIQSPDKPVPLAAVDTQYPKEVAASGRVLDAETKREPTAVKDVTSFYGVGFRAGLFRFDTLGASERSRQIAPDLLSYVDFVWGQHGTYRDAKLIATGLTEGTNLPFSKYIFVQNPRYMLEARYKLPFVPAQIGVDYNVATHGVEKSSADFRVVFATRLDAAAMLGKIFGGGKDKKN